MSLILPDQFGERRFVCECGQRFKDGGVAIQHTFDGHEVGVERYGLGGWHWDAQTTVAEMILERVREKGESVSQFVRRVQAKAEALQRRAEAQEAN